MDEEDAKLLTLGLRDVKDMLYFMEEFTGQVQAMLLELYQLTGNEIPQWAKDYKFKSVNPWGNKGQ